MTRVLRWGVLSTALINEKVMAGAGRCPDVEVVAIGSRDLRRAQAFAQRWQIERAYGSYDEVLADDSLDAVYIPLPNGLHHAWTLHALSAGKHVLCEKPYSRDPTEVIEAFDQAESRGLVLSEAFMYRYHPQTTELARAVRAGLIGDVRLINSSFTWPADAPGDIRLDPALDGGSLLDVGAYCISAARLIGGQPRSVAAHRVLGPTGVDISMTATMELQSDALAHFDCGFHLPDRSHLEIVGTLGSITVSDPWHCYNPALTFTLQGEAPLTRQIPQANSYGLQFEQFGRAVRGEPHQLLGRDDALGQAQTLEAIIAAVVPGARVALG